MKSGGVSVGGLNEHHDTQLGGNHGYPFAYLLVDEFQDTDPL